MSILKFTTFLFAIFIIASIFETIIYFKDKEIENLNKQIELLQCYKENYLIMADSIQNIHVKCFKIGE